MKIRGKKSKSLVCLTRLFCLWKEVHFFWYWVFVGFRILGDVLYLRLYVKGLGDALYPVPYPPPPPPPPEEGRHRAGLSLCVCLGVWMRV